jgi:capsular polysaccharide transport system permease protein
VLAASVASSSRATGRASLGRLLETQFQIIRALAIRDMQSQQADLVHGFAWVFFDAFLAFAGLLIMRLAIRGFNPPGVPPMTFLVSGLVPWLMFSACYNLPDGAIRRGRKLLTLPRVTELDLVVASALRIFMTFAVLYVILGPIACFYDHVPFPRVPIGILLLFLAMWVMGVSFGLLLMAMNRVYPPAAKFVTFFLRFSTIFSGVIFNVTMFPPIFWPYLAWNPFLHIEQLLRTYWFYTFDSPIGSPLYVAQCLVGLLFLGLLLERYARRRLPL